MAKVIPLKRQADSTRDIGHGSEPYAACPPVTVPYGWRLSHGLSGWFLVHDRAQWSTIMWLISERRAGRSYQSLADQLERERVPAPPGGGSRAAGRWYGERVRLLVLHYAPDLAAPAPRDPLAERAAELRARIDDLTDDEQDELSLLS